MDYTGHRASSRAVGWRGTASSFAAPSGWQAWPNQALQQTAGHDSSLGLIAHRCPAAAELSRSAAEAVRMALFIHPNQCLLFIHDPESKFTPERMKEALAEEGVKANG